VGSSHLFVDTVNNRVGITTASPGASLEVNGNVHVATDVTFGGTLTGDGSGLTNVNSDSGSWVNGTGNVYLSTTTDKVGIGTSDPTDLLHIKDGSIRLDSTGTVSIINKHDTSDYGVLSLDAGYRGGSSRPKIRIVGYQGQASVNGDNLITFHTNGSERMKINQDGNVGVGTTSPSAELHVNGVIKQTGASWALTNTGVNEAVNGGGSYQSDYAYFNRGLSSRPNVTLTTHNQKGYNTRSRITVDVAGKYAIYINGFRQTGTSGTKSLSLYKNGAYVHVRAYSGPEGTSNYATAGSSYTIMDLNANDYLEVYIAHGTFHGNDSIYFVGHLIA